MKQQVVERARGGVEAFLRKQYPGGALDVMSVNPEVEAFPVVPFIAESEAWLDFAVHSNRVRSAGDEAA